MFIVSHMSIVTQVSQVSQVPQVPQASQVSQEEVSQASQKDNFHEDTQLRCGRASYLGDFAYYTPMRARIAQKFTERRMKKITRLDFILGLRTPTKTWLARLLSGVRNGHLPIELLPGLIAAKVLGPPPYKSVFNCSFFIRNLMSLSCGLWKLAISSSSVIPTVPDFMVIEASMSRHFCS